MLKEKIKLTYNDYLTLPEEKRYELMEGELFIVPAPDFYHQIVSGNVVFPHIPADTRIFAVA